MIRFFLLSPALAISLALTACGSRAPHLSDDFGNSVRHNMAVQIVTPPDSSTRTDPTPMDGDRAMRALRNYRVGMEPATAPVSTSDVGQ